MRYYDSLAMYPISGNVSYAESYAEHLSRRSRGGIDYAAPCGSPLYAPTRGRVVNWSGPSAGLAINFWHIDDNGVEDGTYDQFMHLSVHGRQGVFEPGQELGGARSGTTGTSTGCHIHWDYVVNGRVVRQWEYFREDPIKKKVKTMYYNRVKTTGWQYVVTADYVRVISPDEVRHVAWNMGTPVEHATLDDFILWCKALNIPADKVKALSTTNRTWSRLVDIENKIK